MPGCPRLAQQLTVANATVLLALAPTGAPAAAQAPPTAVPVTKDVDDFVSAVRGATGRYRDQAAAIADGYRRIGPDFPSMGEHWLSIPLVVKGVVDPLHPPILEYVTVAGRPVLAGVAYTQLVHDGLPRASLPAPASAWHYHAGSVDEESFILGHARISAMMGAGAAADSGVEPRIAVLHAWVWLDNPAGLFATDNWALPWHRLGISPPGGSDGPTPAGLAAALASGGEQYFLALLRLRDGLSPDRSRRVAAMLDRLGREWRGRLRAAADQGLPPPVMELSAGWSALEAELRRLCGTCTLSPSLGHRHASH
jgi:hypothetical protein